MCSSGPASTYTDWPQEAQEVLLDDILAAGRESFPPGRDKTAFCNNVYHTQVVHTGSDITRVPMCRTYVRESTARPSPRPIQKVCVVHI
jgi:hypothetical protein